MTLSARNRAVIVLAIASLTATTASTQSAVIRINGPRALTLSANDLSAMPRTTVKVTGRTQEETYEGVSVRELLTRAGVPTGEELRGQELASAVLVTGADGYRVAYGIAEFDPAFTDRVGILADKKDGAALTGNAAPFELILTGEKHPSRWVRQVVSISLERLGQR